MSYFVDGHRLVQVGGAPVPFRASPHSRPGLTPKYLIMHYTAGSSAAGALSVMLSKNAYVSAHLLIGRDGAITQLVPFDRQAYHAGRSRWEADKSLNRWSLGIELVNVGWLKFDQHEWRDWTGRKVPIEQVIMAHHENGGPVMGWQSYPEAQIRAAVEAARALRAAYNFEAILGHDQVATPKGRKQDPGPAFDRQDFRDRVFHTPVVAKPQPAPDPPLRNWFCRLFGF